MVAEPESRLKVRRVRAICWSVFEVLEAKINKFLPVAPKAVVSLEAHNDYDIFRYLIVIQLAVSIFYESLTNKRISSSNY